MKKSEKKLLKYLQQTFDRAIGCDNWCVHANPYSGVTVCVVRQSNTLFRYSTTLCHPNDRFSIKKGTLEALNRFHSFEGELARFAFKGETPEQAAMRLSVTL